MAGEIILGVVGWVVGCFIMAGVVENIKEGMNRLERYLNNAFNVPSLALNSEP